MVPTDEARKQARIAIGEHANGADPITARRRRRGHTLRSFIDDVYGPWQHANRKTWEETSGGEAVFAEFSG